MPYIDPTISAVTSILVDDTIDAAAKTAAIREVTDPERILARALRRDVAADRLGDALAELDEIGRESGLSPAEWLAEIREELVGYADRYKDWLNAPGADDVWPDDETTAAEEPTK